MVSGAASPSLGTGGAIERLSPSGGAAAAATARAAAASRSTSAARRSASTLRPLVVELPLQRRHLRRLRLGLRRTRRGNLELSLEIFGARRRQRRPLRRLRRLRRRGRAGAAAEGVRRASAAASCTSAAAARTAPRRLDGRAVALSASTNATSAARRSLWRPKPAPAATASFNRRSPPPCVDRRPVDVRLVVC